ncbi:MAG TPA: CBS domain-containing protein [Rhodocyclaceae bacterium]|nr:CBS domain-containing protein [Rhodocyclaceae bacterium]
MEHPNYSPLAQFPMASAGCRVLDEHNPLPVRGDSPALDVMTDLAKIPAATIAPNDLLSDANQSMLLRGVRLLLVTTDDDEICGVIATADFLGPKPVHVAEQLGVMRHELRVRDVMTPVDQVQVLRFTEVTGAKVGHIVATLKAVTRVHALVVEEVAGQEVLRGIFSASQIARQLGIPVVSHEVARTFNEIDALIGT